MFINLILLQLVPAAYDAKLGGIDTDWQGLWRASHLYKELLRLKQQSISISEQASSTHIAGDALPFWIAMNEVSFLFLCTEPTLTHIPTQRMIRAKAVLLHATDSLFDTSFPLSSNQPPTLPHSRLSVVTACLAGYELLNAQHHIEHRILGGVPTGASQTRLHSLFIESLASLQKYGLYRLLLFTLSNTDLLLYSQGQLGSIAVNIAPIFESIVEWVKVNLIPLIEIGKRLEGPHSNGSGYHFILRAVWIPLFKFLSSDVILQDAPIALKGFIPSTIFGSRNSHVFHGNYLAFSHFMDQLEALGPTHQHILVFRQHPEYKAFCRRWDLDTYFGLR